MNGFSTHKHTRKHVSHTYWIWFLRARICVGRCQCIHVLLRSCVLCAVVSLRYNFKRTIHLTVQSTIFDSIHTKLYCMPKCDQINSNCLLKYHKKFNANYLLELCITHLSCGLIQDISYYFYNKHPHFHRNNTQWNWIRLTSLWNCLLFIGFCWSRGTQIVRFPNWKFHKYFHANYIKLDETWTPLCVLDFHLVGFVFIYSSALSFTVVILIDTRNPITNILCWFFSYWFAIFLIHHLHLCLVLNSSALILWCQINDFRTFLSNARARIDFYMLFFTAKPCSDRTLVR